MQVGGSSIPLTKFVECNYPRKQQNKGYIESTEQYTQDISHSILLGLRMKNKIWHIATLTTVSMQKECQQLYACRRAFHTSRFQLVIQILSAQ